MFLKINFASISFLKVLQQAETINRMHKPDS